MANVLETIRMVARRSGVRQDIVEKDYALSYLMAAIAETQPLGEEIVLKGGTALRKLYFENYRFSEDLDYSTRVPGPIHDLDEWMQAVVKRMLEKLNQRGPFQARWEPLILPNPHPGDQKACLVRLQFPRQTQPFCRIKIEITCDEPVYSEIRYLPVIHSFDEEFSAIGASYSLLEITAEKMRALLQSRARLQERGWGASRVCRDYYDLWHLLQQPDCIGTNLVPLLFKKCTIRKVHFSSAKDFLVDELLHVAQTEWPQQLQPFVPQSPAVEKVLSEVGELIKNLW